MYLKLLRFFLYILINFNLKKKGIKISKSTMASFKDLQKFHIFNLFEESKVKIYFYEQLFFIF